MKLAKIFTTLIGVTGLAVPGAAAEVPWNEPKDAVVFPEAIVLGSRDNRVPSVDPRIGRITNDTGTTPFCTGWALSNGAFLTAGHCATENDTGSSRTLCPALLPAFQAIEFNVPRSGPKGQITPAEPRDRYMIDRLSVQCQLAVVDTVFNGEFRKDWALFTVIDFSFEDNGFFRPVALAGFPPPKISSVRVTGFGVAGPPPFFGKTTRLNDPPERNQLNKTQQTDAGMLLGSFSSSGGFINLRYLVDTNPANSGSPVLLNGTSLALGIHDAGDAENKKFNYGTSLQLRELKEALHAFPGAALNPSISGADIFYVDYEVPAFPAPDGNLFTPFPTLTAAFSKISTVPRNTLISVIAGSYPEKINENTGLAEDIDVTLQGDTILVLPVGSVSIWRDAGAPPG